MTGHSNETLAEDIRELARMLLADPETGPIIHDAGVRRAFTPEEDDLVFGRAKSAPMMAMFQERLARKERCGQGWHWNPKVAIGVARQVADGLIKSVDALTATDLIERNLFPAVPPEDDRASVSNKRIPFDLYHEIFCDFIEMDEFESLRQNWLSSDGDSDPRYNSINTYEAPARERQLRYGEIALVDYGSLAHAVVLKRIHYRDKRELLDFFRSYNGVLEQFFL